MDMKEEEEKIKDISKLLLQQHIKKISTR